VEKKVVIFTDGACSGNPGPGGWGAILVSPLGKVKELGAGENHTTNNRMELTAAVEALRVLSRVKALSTKGIRIYTDSTYVIRGITQWIHGWKKRGWKNQEGGDVSNRELWEALDEVIRKHRFQVEWLYVPGHKGFAGNERCDRIAVAFAKKEPIRLYDGSLQDYPVDVAHVPPPSPIPDPKRKKGPVVYLSLVEGQLHRDPDWKSCEARVRGRQGARFKKVQSPEEEESVLRGWGVKS
jgi:ribonuclease HI